MTFREYYQLIGVKIVKVDDGIDGLRLTVDDGIGELKTFEIQTHEYPDGGYRETTIQKVE